MNFGLQLGFTKRLGLAVVSAALVLSDRAFDYFPEDRDSITGVDEDVTAIADQAGNHDATVTGAIFQKRYFSKGNQVLGATYSASNLMDTGTKNVGGDVLYCEAGTAWQIDFFGMKASTFNGYFMSQANFSNRMFRFGYDTGNGGQIYVAANGESTVLETNMENDLFNARVIWDGTEMRAGMMLDGESEFTYTTCAIGAGAKLTSNNIVFFAREPTGGAELVGSIGRVVAYNRILTEEENNQNERYGAANWTNKPYDARIVLLGDSIMQGSWDTALDNTAMNIDTAFALGGSAYVEVFEEGDPGETAEFFANNIDTILGDYSVQDYPTYFIGHIGTNNITQTLPYHDPVNRFEALINGFADDLTYIHNAITTAGHKLFYGQAPFYDRPYPDPNSGNKTGLVQEFQYMGARPYNENIIEPWLFTNTPEYCFPDGTPYLQFYDLTYNDQTIISADGIHPSFSGYQKYYKYFAEVVGKVIKGVVPTPIAKAPNDDLVGSTFVIATNSETDPTGTNINWTEGAMNTSGGTLQSLIGSQGEETPYNLDYSSFSNHNGNTRATTGNTADSLSNSTLLESDMRTYNGGGNMTLEAANLPPGATVRAKIVGSTTLPSPTGQLVSFENETAITHNIRSFPPTVVTDDIAVPADGRLSILVTEDNTNNTASICGVSFEVMGNP